MLMAKVAPVKLQTPHTSPASFLAPALHPAPPDETSGGPGAPLSPTAIISYDGTASDHDALSLGRLLAQVGARLELAYVRHTTQSERVREELEEHEAAHLLERGAITLGDLDVPRRVVVSASTAEGLRRLAQEEAANILVFGSDYRTAAGHVAPQRSAQTLLEGGPAAIAIAPASYRIEHAGQFGRVGLLASPEDEDALCTAHDVARAWEARVTRGELYVDLLVVGSRPEAPEGRVMISSRAQNAVQEAMCPVLVVPRGVAIRFPGPVAP
jgi:nucleotide-binding universal stress UspA family protein